MTSITQIQSWTKKYGMDEGEVEILLRCHNSIVNPKDGSDSGSFLNLLAHSFPYVFFFLPHDEIKNRIELVENHILPKNFGEKLRSAIFPAKGTETENESTELLIQGISNCCKGDANETLGVIFDCCASSEGKADPSEIIQLCYQLSIAAQVLVSPNIDEQRVLKLSKQPLNLHGLTVSLTSMAKTSKEKGISKKAFIDWGTKSVPHIGSTLQGFIYNLVFHGKSSHSKVPPFTNPELIDSSIIFTEANAGNLFTISCMSPDLGGKWRRLFSTADEGCDIHSLETVISKHVGPTIFVIKVDTNHLIGGVAESGWKFGYFMFEIEPSSRIHHSAGGTKKFFVRHNIEQVTSHGETLVGSGFYQNGDKNTPDLFISDHFHWCKASFLDVPFSSKVEAMEVWGVEVIKAGESLKSPLLTTHEEPHDPQ